FAHCCRVVRHHFMPRILFFFSSRRRHTRSTRDWSSDVCSSDLPGNDDRELLLMPESPCGGGDRPIVMGIVLSDPDKSFMHKEYPSMADANRAFRAAARELRHDGYVETAHTDYTLRNLLPDPAAKPDWQRALDE